MSLNSAAPNQIASSWRDIVKVSGLKSSMGTVRFSHSQREQEVLSDLEAHFPDFAGRSLSWSKVADGQDPPDFIGRSPHGLIGLELIEWLDGGQMGPAMRREWKRSVIRHVLGEEWQAHYQPQKINLAVLMPNWALRIAGPDEARLRQEFFACVEVVDKTWLTNSERVGSGYYQTDLSAYPVLAKYFHAIRYIEGFSHGFCWIDVEEDGGAYDPTATVLTLEQALDKKLALYSTTEKQAHLSARELAELDLIVHGGFNVYRYNAPSGSLSLEDIAKRGADFYAAHPQRQLFNRVWFFHSLDSADEANELFGLPAGYGRVRWLAQIWPSFAAYPRSVGA